MSIEKLQTGSILPTKVVCTEITESEKVLKSGIVIVEPRRSPQAKGKIVLVGEGTPQIKMTAKVGWIALFAPLSSQKFEYEGNEYLLIDNANLLFMYPPTQEEVSTSL